MPNRTTRPGPFCKRQLRVVAALRRAVALPRTAPAWLAAVGLAAVCTSALLPPGAQAQGLAQTTAQAPASASAPAPAPATSPAPSPAPGPEPDTAAVPAEAAFALEITAPAALKALLADQLEIARFRSMADLTRGELARLVAQVPADARQLLATAGYFSPEVQVSLREAPAAGGAPTVTVNVAPGEVTRVTRVTVTLQAGASPAPAMPDTQATTQAEREAAREAEQRRQQIAERWTLPPGQPFTQADWSSAKQQALRLLTARDYPQGRIADSSADIDPDNHSASLRVVLDPGPAFRLGTLAISGAARYGEDLVARLAQLWPGQTYAQLALTQAQQRLTDSGFYDAAQVTIDTESDPRAARVLVRVVESPSHKWVLGVGASTDSGARFSATYTDHLTFGRPLRSVTKVSVDRVTRLVSSEFTGRPDANHWAWAASAQLQSQLTGSFDVLSQRLRAGRSRGSVPRDDKIYLQYDRAPSARNEALQADEVQALSLNYAVTLRRFDALPFASSGWGLGLELGGGSTVGAIRTPYSRSLARWQAFWPLGGDALASQRAGRLALRGQVGAVVANARADLPATELFLAGGDNSVRGYAQNTIGVRLPGNLITAGRYLSVASVEWQRPIVRDGRVTDWEGALFVDAGAVSNGLASFKPQGGVGAGVRWKSPVGPLQIDLAYGVPVHRLRLHVNLGFSF